jgi:hypothetical protein
MEISAADVIMLLLRLLGTEIPLMRGEFLVQPCRSGVCFG